jgi:hypothetical protein
MYDNYYATREKFFIFIRRADCMFHWLYFFAAHCVRHIHLCVTPCAASRGDGTLYNRLFHVFQFLLRRVSVQTNSRISHIVLWPYFAATNPCVRFRDVLLRYLTCLVGVIGLFSPALLVIEHDPAGVPLEMNFLIAGVILCVSYVLHGALLNFELSKHDECMDGC